MSYIVLYCTNLIPMHQHTFSERVIAIAQSIPPGRVTTYGDVARAAGGGAQSARSITSILSRASKDGVTDIPFHRIVYADGRIWAANAVEVQRLRLYQNEGIIIEKGRVKNFDRLRV